MENYMVVCNETSKACCNKGDGMFTIKGSFEPVFTCISDDLEFGECEHMEKWDILKIERKNRIFLFVDCRECIHDDDDEFCFKYCVKDSFSQFKKKQPEPTTLWYVR